MTIRCPQCFTAIPVDATRCPSCGSSTVDSFSPTQRIETPALDIKRPTPATRSYDSIDDARFVPGTILADRYRIVGLLGKGGMGEVYRADDLKLGQPVALKFLPDKLLRDGASLARFHREVRVARQVSHKNVCRVYDIGETNGHHFLSMEYIKGEELSSLLRRIGRLPPDKALQIARQICAGLAAAHDSNVLHRDLKPSNIMIDGDGNARVLDFGLAGLSEEFKQDEISSGTPAYMAPEQLAGKQVTLRSDIYSLGLVLYELFTGKRAYEAATLGELMKLRMRDTTPTSPTSLVKDLDPLIERTIDRCLQRDPSRRPASALQVAAALPGGDPIAAALAAGEIPSPEMVAAAPKEGALRPAKAIALLGGSVLAIILIVVFAEKMQLYGQIPYDKSPELLAERAREALRKARHEPAAFDFMDGFSYDNAPLDYIQRTDLRHDRWQHIRDGQPAVINYWYRQSTGYLGDFDYFRDPLNNPPPTVAGMAGVTFDTRGRLLSFYSVPPQIDPVFAQSTPTTGSSNDVNTMFAPLFVEAGLDITKFQPTASQWAPLYLNDTRAAWQGVYPQQPGIPIRVEAAAYRAKPVYFEIVNPWAKPERQDPRGLPGQFKILFALLISVFVIVLVGSVIVAIRNLRLGRGDRSGALRLGVFVFTLTLLTRVFAAHHVPEFSEFGIVLNALQDAVFAGIFFWVVYLALEPFVRRRWPDRIISWSRLLAGDFRDPLVGRDFLIGGVIGFGITVFQIFYFLLIDLVIGPQRPVFEPAAARPGLSAFIESFSSQLSSPLFYSLQQLFVILLIALLLKRDKLAFVAGTFLFTMALAVLWGGSIYNWIAAAVTAGLLTFTLYRFGLLAMMAAIFFLQMYIHFPVTRHFTAWWAAGFTLDLIIMLGVLLYSFRSALGGQSLSGAKLLDDFER